ncbi:Mur ligase family protein [Kordiimonas aquimaris]|uniref:Mur ligase family protein n=1 Tax=Kordiimonas aquimaris TaxID=707591 RepID=UPI0021CF1590|nr:UDP-N-acetylmuramoyl-tripeptide--D-alanyl-D-alanine ligase [Kordiimonas aquimaris]
MIESVGLDNTTALLFGVFAILCLWFAFVRGNAFLMFFQQEEYDNPRFVVWLKEKRAYDITATIVLIAAIIASAMTQSDTASESLNTAARTLIPFAIATTAMIAGVLRSYSTSRNNKKPLVVTDRVKRIRYIYLLLLLGLLVAFLYVATLAPFGAHYSLTIEDDPSGWFDTFRFLNASYDWRLTALLALTIVLVQLLPFLIIAANKILEPAEERVKAKFRAEAAEKFNRLKPTVIAITGSFGKTSTKHILAHIMDAAAPTIATPGSVNTEMGITRIIREKLTEQHQYFIVEMGAYGPGSIARLCRLTPPNVALVTAVGAAHYERFKTLETVAKAKFEIAEAAFAQGGQAVINADGIEEKLRLERMQAVPGDYTVVGKEGDVRLIDYNMTKQGLVISVADKDGEHTLKAPIFGQHQAENILMAAVTARAVGLPWSAIKGALASLPQIRFRLEVSQSAGSPTIINDAYNSNPIGFAGALECLDVLVEQEGRRILVTPGMVELGALHDSEHARLGALAAKHADIVCVVTPDRIPTFVKGLEGANNGQTTVMQFATQEDAETWVKNNWRAGDAVLFENNLPDLYEATVKF